MLGLSWVDLCSFGSVEFPDLDWVDQNSLILVKFVDFNFVGMGWVWLDFAEFFM